MYRVTGNPMWQEKAWKMFQAIEKATRTEFGYTGLRDVNTPYEEQPDRLNSCESFWTGARISF